jgi:catechol 2,3-dioxygenase-like lactoylglutathione lyase family enzyme
MSAVAGTSAVWLPVSDLDRAADFYLDHLGLSEHRRGENWAELDSDGLRVGLNANEQPRGGGAAVIAFRPQGGLDETVDRLRGEGVEFADGISEHPWGRVASFKDPDGNDLQLYEPPAA